MNSAGSGESRREHHQMESPVRVGRLDEIPRGSSKTVEAFGRTVAVFNDDGRLLAIDAVCPHRGGPLDLGLLSQGAVTCPLHGWSFDLETGQRRDRPGECVSVYEVMLEGTEVFVGFRPRPSGTPAGPL
jgi:nitrite reductase (NADH) small subunit